MVVVSYCRQNLTSQPTCALSLSKGGRWRARVRAGAGRPVPAGQDRGVAEPHHVRRVVAAFRLLDLLVARSAFRAQRVQVGVGDNEVNLGALSLPMRELSALSPSTSSGRLSEAPQARNAIVATMAEVLTTAQFAEAVIASGQRMGEIFALAKRHIDMDLAEIEELLQNPHSTVRLGAVCVMDFQARRRSTPPRNARRCTSSTCDATTGSTTGRWSTEPRPQWSAGIWSTSRAIRSTGWPNPSRCGSAGQRSSPPGPSSESGSSTTPSPSLNCWSTTRST